jgi:hypothetical protein
VPGIAGIEVTMTNAIKRSDLKYPPKVIEEAGEVALEPVIQSAFGIVRESAGLLYQIARLGIALLSGPKPKCGVTHPAAPKRANVVPLPQLETSSRRPDATGINHDHDQ